VSPRAAKAFSKPRVYFPSLIRVGCGAPGTPDRRDAIPSSAYLPDIKQLAFSTGALWCRHSDTTARHQIG
jgi:hypothetical protein